MSEAKEVTMIASGNGFKLIPRSLEEAQKIAAQLATSRLIPFSYKNGGKVNEADLTLAFLMGAELGLSVVQCLQYIDIISSKLYLRVKAMKGIVKRHPDFEYMKEREAKDEKGNKIGYECVLKRKNEAEHISVYTKADAVAANLWGKAGPWVTHAGQMLMKSATAKAMRAVFSDVLEGFDYSAEEAEDIPVGIIHTSTENGGSDPKAAPSDKLADKLAQIMAPEPKDEIIEDALDLVGDEFVDEEDAR